MTKSALYDTTRTRLENYEVFSVKALDLAASAASEIARYETYQKFFKTVDVPLKPTLFMTSQGKGVPLIDISARSSEERGVFVVYLPMGNSLDTNQLYQVASLAQAFPAYRIIAFGNPSAKPYAYREQNFSVAEWFRVVCTSNRRAVVSAELEYLSSQGIKDAYHIGYSFGALKAMLAAYYSAPDALRRLILIDPVAHSRGLKQLLEDFQHTFKPLGAYVDRTELRTFFEARAEAARTVNHTRGLMRPVNIAIGIALARVDFIPFLEKILQKKPQLSAHVAWGSKSELGNDAHMKASLHHLAYETAKGRVRSLRLEDDAHAFANDISLYAAIVYDALH